MSTSRGEFTYISAGGGETYCKLSTDGTSSCGSMDSRGGWSTWESVSELASISTGGEGFFRGVKTDGSVACWGRGFTTDFPRVQYIVAQSGRVCVSGAGFSQECFGEPPPQ